MTVLLMLCIILAAVALLQGIRADVYKQRAVDAENILDLVRKTLDELKAELEEKEGGE